MERIKNSELKSSRESLTRGVIQIMSKKKERTNEDKIRPRRDEEKNGETGSVINLQVWSKGFMPC